MNIKTKAAVAVAIGASLSPGTAFAASKGMNDPNVSQEKLQQAAAEGQVIDGVDVRADSKKPKNSGGDITAQSDVSLTATNYLSCMGVTNGTRATFSDTMNYGPGSGHGDGTSYVDWWGQNPWNADKITMRDNFNIGGISVNFSLPLGANFSGSSTSQTWTLENTNTWRITHSYSNVAWTGLGLTYDRSTGADFKFGSTYCSPNASGRKYL